ncbi:MAG TPA: hypothetical protein VGD07_01140 [Methylomirabilota bacterium]|jgi:hypothetical protein
MTTVRLTSRLILVPALVAGLAASLGGARVAIDTMWVMVAAFLVFFMNLGFAAVESGFCRAKNTVTIMAKNFVVFAVASIAFLAPWPLACSPRTTSRPTRPATVSCTAGGWRS